VSYRLIDHEPEGRTDKVSAMRIVAHPAARPTKKPGTMPLRLRNSFETTLRRHPLQKRNPLAFQLRSSG
jgi:hypothetical protein